MPVSDVVVFVLCRHGANFVKMSENSANYI